MEHWGTGGTNIFANVVEQQLRSWIARRATVREKLKEDSGFRFLTIGRDEGSLENEISQELALRLGWHVFDREIVACIAKFAKSWYNSWIRSLKAWLRMQSPVF